MNNFQNRIKLCDFCGTLSASDAPFCSNRCRNLTIACNAKCNPGLGHCSHCGEKKNILIHMMVDDHKLIMCSNRCFDEYVKQHDLVLGRIQTENYSQT